MRHGGAHGGSLLAHTLRPFRHQFHLTTWGFHFAGSAAATAIGGGGRTSGLMHAGPPPDGAGPLERLFRSCVRPVERPWRCGYLLERGARATVEEGCRALGAELAVLTLAALQALPDGDGGGCSTAAAGIHGRPKECRCRGCQTEKGLVPLRDAAAAVAAAAAVWEERLLGQLDVVGIKEWLQIESQNAPAKRRLRAELKAAESKMDNSLHWLAQPSRMAVTVAWEGAHDIGLHCVGPGGEVTDNRASPPRRVCSLFSPARLSSRLSPRLSSRLSSRLLVSSPPVTVR